MRKGGDHDILKQGHLLKNLRGLKNPRNAELGNFMRWPPRQFRAGKDHFSGIGLEATNAHIQQCRFTGAVWADNRMCRPFLDAQIDVGKSAEATKALVNIIKMKNEIAHNLPSTRLPDYALQPSAI